MTITQYAYMLAPSAAAIIISYWAVRYLIVRAIPELSALPHATRQKILSGYDRVELPTKVLSLRILVSYGILGGILVFIAVFDVPEWLFSISFAAGISAMIIIRFQIAKPYWIQDIRKELSKTESIKGVRMN